MILGLDLETTGLNAGTDRIIELCFGLYDNNCNKIQNLVKRFNPQKPIDPKAQAVHGISNAELMNCPTFDTHAELLSQLMSKADLVVIHNAKFDAPFLAAEFQRCGVKVPDVMVYDTMVESRWATPDGKWPKLGQLCYALNVDYDANKAHAADYDVDKMMSCFAEINKRNRLGDFMGAFNQIKPYKR